MLPLTLRTGRATFAVISTKRKGENRKWRKSYQLRWSCPLSCRQYCSVCRLGHLWQTAAIPYRYRHRIRMQRKMSVKRKHRLRERRKKAKVNRRALWCPAMTFPHRNVPVRKNAHSIRWIRNVRSAKRITAFVSMWIPTWKSQSIHRQGGTMIPQRYIS